LKIWKRDIKRAMIENTMPRYLRHKALTDVKKAGFNNAFAGNVASHSDPRTTKRYTQFSVEETRVPLISLEVRA
jgi:hypothetical protein